MFGCLATPGPLRCEVSAPDRGRGSGVRVKEVHNPLVTVADDRGRGCHEPGLGSGVEADLGLDSVSPPTADPGGTGGGHRPIAEAQEASPGGPGVGCHPPVPVLSRIVKIDRIYSVFEKCLNTELSSSGS